MAATASKGSAQMCIKDVSSRSEFEAWFAQELADAVDAVEQPARVRLSTLQAQKESMSAALFDASTALEHVEAVVAERRAAEAAAERVLRGYRPLLAHKEALVALEDALESYLTHFDRLDSLALLLDQPDEFLCLRPEFVPALQHMEESIDFLLSHPEFIDTASYLTGYHVCRRKAAISIRRHLASAWRGLASEISRKMTASAGQLSDGERYQLHHVKFRASAHELAPLIAQLELQASLDESSADILAECYADYFTTRRRLIESILSTRLKVMSDEYEDILAYVQASCVHLGELCHEEFQLYHAFFTTATPLLGAYLNLLLGQLAARLRPLLLREQDKDTLLQVIALIRAHMVDIPIVSDCFGDQGDADDAGSIRGMLLIAQAKLNDSDAQYANADDSACSIQ